MRTPKPRKIADIQAIVKNVPSIQHLIDRGTDRIFIIG